MTTTKYNGEEFIVDEHTLDIHHNGKVLKPAYIEQLKRWFVQYKDNNGNAKIAPRARIICLAFHPNKNYRRLQTDHIDSDTMNDTPENLRWVTRKQNNSTEHSKQMRKQNHKCMTHRNEIVKATDMNSGEVRYFANGREAAGALHCSHVLVHYALESRNHSANGWKLEWTSELGVEKTEQIKRERTRAVSAKKKLMNQKKREETARKREAMKKEKEQKKTCARLQKQLKTVLDRIDLWKKHIKKLENKASGRKTDIAQKIECLQQEAQIIEAMIKANSKVEA